MPRDDALSGLATIVTALLIAGAVWIFRTALVGRISLRRRSRYLLTLLATLFIVLPLIAGMDLLSRGVAEALNWLGAPEGDVLRLLGESPAVAAGAVAGVALSGVATAQYALGTIGLRPQQFARNLSLGFLLGVALIGILLVAGLGGGWFSVTDLATWPDLAVAALGGLVLFAAVGLAEELIFRGAVMTLLSWAFWPWLGLAVNAAIFGLAHAGNAGASLAGVVNVGLFGVMTGIFYLRSGSLWLPIGLHWGWDFGETSIFGFPDSGLPPHSVVNLQVHGPDLWTGGAFGPEASLLTPIVIVLGLVTVLGLPGRFWGRSSGGLRPRALVEPVSKGDPIDA